MELFDIYFDAFQHGEYPAIVIIKKNISREELYVVNVDMKGTRYDKSLSLNRMHGFLKISPYEKATKNISNQVQFTLAQT